MGAVWHKHGVMKDIWTASTSAPVDLRWKDIRTMSQMNSRLEVVCTRCGVFCGGGGFDEEIFLVSFIHQSEDVQR